MSQKKQYLIGNEARKKLLEGAKVVYDLVSPTSGPKGRNIAYARPWGLPRIINDGIEIAKEVGSEDDALNVGIDLIREAAQNTVTEAGDGTTTAIILAYHILKQGTEMVEKGSNPMVLRSQIQACLNLLLKDVHKLSTKVESKEKLREVALISSSGDEEIADVVAETVFEMGKDGIVTVEEGFGTKIEYEMTKGMQLQKGFLDSMFITDDMRMEAVVVDPAIIVIEQTITAESEIVPLLNELAKASKNIVIFGNVQGDALKVLILNKMRGVFNALAVNPPGYQDQRLAVLQDIAAVTGTFVITNATKTFTHQQVGSASHVSANKHTTTIVKGKGAQKVIELRVADIREKLESSISLYEKEKFEERLAKMTAGVALIKVGAKSETTKREKLEKVKDAVGATKAALAEGVVTGGGMTFIQLATKVATGVMNDGQQILYTALLAPTEKILLNAGKDKKEIEEQMHFLLNAGKDTKSMGYNVNTDKIEDLRKAGVIDPLRVIRLSLENAVEVATSMLTADGLIVPVAEKKLE